MYRTCPGSFRCALNLTLAIAGSPLGFLGMPLSESRMVHRAGTDRGRQWPGHQQVLRQFQSKKTGTLLVKPYALPLTIAR